MLLIYVGGLVDTRAIVRQEGLGQLNFGSYRCHITLCQIEVSEFSPKWLIQTTMVQIYSEGLAFSVKIGYRSVQSPFFPPRLLSKNKHYNIQNYNFVRRFIWVMILSSPFKGRTQAEGAEKYIWASDGGSTRRLEKAAYMICISHRILFGS
jgi:hypothetical protein